MFQEIITRAEARERGLKHYFTGKPCKNGHISARQVGCCQCLECDRERKSRFYANNPEKISERHARYRAENPEKVREYQSRYRSENHEKIKEYKARYRAKIQGVAAAGKKSHAGKRERLQK